MNTLAEKDIETKAKATCYHCGDPCGSDLVKQEGKDFCCEGCKTVYEILNENGLCNYYDLEKNPGITLKSPANNDQFAYLESKEVADQLLDFQSDSLNKLTFYIPAIHCSSCIWLLENLYQLTLGVKQSRVNFVKKNLTIGYDPQETNLRQLAELLASIGYAPYISLSQEEKPETKDPNRALFIKIGVAGFSFGNIMMLSFPEYFGLDNLWDQEIQQFIGYINILFALPVFFYCSTDYFKSALDGLKHKFVNIDIPISLGIITLFVRSLYDIISHTGPGFLDSLAGLLFFLLIGKWFQQKTYDGLSFDRDYKSYFPLGITRISGGILEPIALKQIEVGDRLLVRNQEIIPADAVLLSPAAAIDYSFVTGESALVQKIKGAYLYAGGRLHGERIEVLVDKEVSQSYLTRLWNHDAFTKSNEDKWSGLVNKIAKAFTGIVLTIAFFTLIYWWVADTSVMIKAFSAVLIVACPCALAMATPFTIGSTMSVFGKLGFYLKNANIIEKMASVTHIVFDKTGTITHPYTAGIQLHGQLDDLEKTCIQSLISQSTHPLSRKLFQQLSAQVSAPLLKVKNFEEAEGKGLSGEIGEQKIRVGSSDWVGFANIVEENITSSRVYFDINGKKGYFSLQNSFRDGLDQLISTLSKSYQMSLISGDNASEREELQKRFPVGSVMRFNQTPQQKLSYIKELQATGAKVLMIGDGLNDAGALKQSDVGIALSENVATFSPSCDGILSAGKFSRLANFLAFAKTTHSIIIASFILSFLYNIVGVSLAVTGNLAPVYAAILMPVSSISVVTFATISIRSLAHIKKLK